jgi:NAD+ diphosphatase
LLGRTPRQKHFSCVAGFIDPEESLENAAVREVLEETGVMIHRVKYAASQPWPFPGQLMLGCIAEAQSETMPECVDKELEEARWFTKYEVKEALNGSGAFTVSAQYSLGHYLLHSWIKDQPLESKSN